MNLLSLRIFVQITLISMCYMMCLRKQIGKGCATHANVCMDKCRIFVFFSCIVLDFLLNLQLKTDTNKQIKAKFNINETNIKVKI